MSRRINKAKSDEKKIFDLKDLKLEEVSLVDEGANPGAEIMLFKRHSKKSFLDKLKGKFEKDAELFEEVEGKQDAFNAMWDMFNSFQDSIHSILNDDEVEDKKSLVSESLGQFNEALSNALTKGGQHMPTKSKMQKAEDDELDATKKTEHEDEIAQMKADHEEEMAAMKTEHEDEMKAKKVEGEDDKDETSKAEDEDEDDKEATKAQKAFSKKLDELAKSNADLTSRLAKSDERVEVAKFEKMADVYDFVPVTKQKLAQLLRHVSKANDDELYGTLETVLGASSEAQSALTKVMGTPLTNSSGTASTAFYTKAAEIQKDEGVSKQKGVQLAKQRNPEMWTAMRKETN